MWKKMKSILMASVFCLTAFSAVAACGKSGGDNTSDTNRPAPGEVGGLMDGDKTLMNGFEMFDRDIQLIRVINDFGVLDDNTNEHFVRSGKHSLKISPLGHRMHNANPYFVLPTTSILYEEVSFGDFSDVETISFWFYNNEEEAVNVGIGFGKNLLYNSTSTDRRDMIQKTTMEYYSLQHGWNYIEYTMEPAYLALQELVIEEVYGVAIEFDYVESHKLVDSPEVYLDDVCLTYTDTPKSDVMEFDFKTGTTAEGNPYWTIADFENPLEAYYFFYGYGPPSGFPVVKSVFTGDYDTVTTVGTQALLIQKKHGGDFYGWPSMRLHSSVMQGIFAAIGDDILQNPDDYVFKVDFYNAGKVRDGCTVRFYGASGDSVSVEPNQWYTYSTTIGRINERKTGEDPYTATLGRIEFMWNRFNTAEDLSDRPLLLDNIRIEKITQTEA